MRQGVVFLLALLFSLSVSATPKIQQWQSSNGAKVLYVHAPELPMLDISVVFDAGSVRDGEKSGLAVLTNAMVPEGAGSLDVSELAERFESVGAIMENDASRDMSSFELRSLSDAELLSQALENFALMLQKPSFPKDALEREKKRILVAIDREKQSPDAISDRRFYKAIYGDHPYGEMSIGRMDTVENLSRDDIKAFYDKYYVSGNALINIVGNVDRKQAEQIAEQLSKGLASGDKAPALAEPVSLQQARKLVVEFPSSQTHVLLGQPAIARGSEDYFALFVGNHILGGSGLVSILSDEIREKRGLAYSSYSYFAPMKLRGPFQMGLQTRNNQAEEALKIMRKTLEDFIKNGPSKNQLQAAKKNLIGGFAMRTDSNKKVLGYLGMIGFYGMPLDYLDQFIPNIEKVTAKQIQQAFKRNLDTDKMVTVLVGGKSS